ncbi:MAG: excisionase family DNA-binding protein [Syntrophales bacterium]|nr:excisionase family DNA-binding protein [Syntrophales bacterium]
MPERLYSTSEVARLLKVNRVTVYRWVKEGKIRAYEIGKHFKISSTEVKRLLSEFGFSEPDICDICKELNGGRTDPGVEYSTGIAKKLVVAVDSSEAGLESVRKMFEKPRLRKISQLLTFSNSLDAAIQIGKKKPDMVLLGARMSDREGGVLAAKIRSLYKDVRIMMISSSPKGGILKQINQSDISGYLEER